MATKYWIGGGSNSNWNAATSNWSTASGGTTRVALATGDDVIFDGVGATANSNSVVTSFTISSLTITSGYTGSLNFNAALSISGSAANLTLGSNMTIAGSANITITGPSTITSNGKSLLSTLILTTGDKIFADNNALTSISISTTNNYILNGFLNVGGSLTIASGVSPTFTGSSGFNAANLICNHVGGATITLTAGLTYSANNFTATGSRTGSPLVITSNHATNRANFNVYYTSSVLANFTRIDASGTPTIWTFNGTVTDSPNVVSFNDIKTIGSSF